MMNAVGGTSIHWMTQSWRFLPWNFKIVSESIKRYGPNSIPKDSTSIDWPFDYAELEPYYDKHEYFVGVSGQHGNLKGAIDQRGNIFEGPRRRPYPYPPLRRSGWTDMMDDAARKSRLASVSRPCRNPLAGVPRDVRLYLLRILLLDGLLHQREGADGRRLHPAGREDEEPHGRAGRRRHQHRGGRGGPGVGRALPEGQTEYFQPAKVVLLAGYTMGTRASCSSRRRRRFPRVSRTITGRSASTRSRHGTGAAGATGWFPGKRLNRYSGTLGQFTRVRRARR